MIFQDNFHLKELAELIKLFSGRKLQAKCLFHMNLPMDSIKSDRMEKCQDSLC